MKEKVKKNIVTILIVLVVGCIPYTSYYEDGGTVVRRAVFYTIVDYKIMKPDGSAGYITGHEEYWFLSKWTFNLDKACRRKKAEYYRSIGKKDIADKIEKELE